MNDLSGRTDDLTGPLTTTFLEKLLPNVFLLGDVEVFTVTNTTRTRHGVAITLVDVRHHHQRPLIIQENCTYQPRRQRPFSSNWRALSGTDVCAPADQSKESELFRHPGFQRKLYFILITPGDNVAFNGGWVRSHVLVSFKSAGIPPEASMISAHPERRRLILCMRMLRMTTKRSGSTK